MIQEAQGRQGYRFWSDRLERGRHRVQVCFVGRGPDATGPTAEEFLDDLEIEPPQVAWARQIHSATVVAGRAGFCGEGDALITHRRALALCVVTADCVPILLVAGEGSGDLEIAAVHAGWRGIAAGVVGATLERLASASASSVAWIGPAIGPCCYEVGEGVARQVAAASTPDAVLPNPEPARPNPHLDLRVAVRHQLEAAGLRDIRTLAACTRCRPEELASYRREGKGAGRNLALIWMRAVG